MYLKCLHSEHVRRSEWQTILYLGDQGHPGGHGSMEGPHPGRSTVGHHLVLIVGGSPIGQVIILLHQLHLHQLRYQVWSYKGITHVHVLDLLMFGFVFFYDYLICTRTCLVWSCGHLFLNTHTCTLWFHCKPIMG